MLVERTWRLGQLPLDMVRWIVRDAAAGLHAAHELGIIHRDLKPENVMLVKNGDGTERAVVLDFGLAEAPELYQGRTKLTMAGMVVGTPDFMSPEQMRDKPLDRRSDVYSLAFMTFEMLTGRSPFDGKTARELAIARLKGEAHAMRERRPELDIPEAVDRVVARAMAVDMNKRYATAPEFAAALERAVRPRPWYRRILGS